MDEVAAGCVCSDNACVLYIERKKDTVFLKYPNLLFGKLHSLQINKYETAPNFIQLNQNLT